MPNRVDIMPPPKLHGTEAEQIDQLWRYIYKLTEQIKIALRHEDDDGR